MREPIFTLYLKTDVDFSKKYPSLNEQNSNFIYKVFLDTIIFDSMGIVNTYKYEIILSSPEKESNDTTYYDIEYFFEIVIPLNYEYMNYPKQYLWQTYLKQLDDYCLPPEPYAYIVDDRLNQ